MPRNIRSISHGGVDRWHVACRTVGTKADFDSCVEEVSDATDAVAETSVAVGVVGYAGAGGEEVLDVFGLEVDAVGHDGFGSEKTVESVHVAVAGEVFVEGEGSVWGLSEFMCIH